MIKKYNEHIKEEYKIDLSVTYELRDRSGYDGFAWEDEEIPQEESDGNYNPFDIVEMTKLLLIKREKYPNAYLVKVQYKKIPDETIEKIKIELDSKKYNL